MAENNLNTQLNCIAWTAIFWTEIEANVDMVLCYALEVPEFARMDLVTRINGFDGKIELIRVRMRRDLGDTHDLYKLMDATLSSTKEWKRHRDAVVHTYPDFEAGTGQTMQRRGKIVSVNISDTTLDIIRQHGNALAEEAATLNNMMLHATNHANRVAQGRSEGTVSQQPAFQSLIAQLQNEQKTRRALRPLPPNPK